MEETYQHVKLMLVGAPNAGKTNLMLRFCEGAFTSSYIATVGVDFKIKTLSINGNRIKCQIWDSSGQERFRSIRSAYYRGTHGAIVVYDVTNEESFKITRNHIHDVLAHSSDETKKMILVGNKCDMINQRQVTKEQGQAFADEYKFPFIETSAKNDINVDEAISLIVSAVIVSRETNLYLPGNELNERTGSFIEIDDQAMLQRLEFPKFIAYNHHLQMFDIKTAIYSFQGLREARKLNPTIVIKAVVMLSFFPITLLYQNIIPLLNKHCGYFGSLIPNQSKIYYAQTRMFFDLLGVIIHPQQDSFTSKKDKKPFVSALELSEHTSTEVYLRAFLILISFIVYTFMLYSFIWYQSLTNKSKTTLTESECTFPFIIFSVLVVTVSLWLAYESKIKYHCIDLKSVAFHPLCFTSKFDDENEESKETTSIGLFLETIASQTLQRKNEKSITILSIAFAILYGLISSISRNMSNKQFVSDYPTIWFFCAINNIVSSYIVIRLCQITTTAAFSDVLACSQAVTQIITPYKTRFISGRHYLPYLDMIKDTNLSSWMQLHGYVYIRSVSRMVNVEIWMVLFILVGIVLSGVCLYRLVERNDLYLPNILEDDVFLSCAMFVILGCVYVYIVVWIGSLFHKLHKEQIRALVCQSASIDYQTTQKKQALLMRGYNDDEKTMDVTNEFPDKFEVERIQNLIERAVIYLQENDITPLIFGVRLDKVLWKSAIGVLLSVVMSIVIIYMKSAN